MAKCALNGITPKKERVISMDFDKLLNYSMAQSMVAIAFMAIESTELDVKDLSREQIKSLQELKMERERALRKSLLLDIEREKLFEYMEQQGIWYMPMKGIVLKELYPNPVMRQMSDNDILFDKEYRKQIEQFMKSRGYKLAEVAASNHDIYIKPPVYNFEMHMEMISQRKNPIWVEYYKNIKDKCVKDKSNKYGYHLSDEDFYIFFTLHAFKHYIGGGTGLRTLMDFYVFNREKYGNLDCNYIEQELKKLGIVDYEKNMRNLSTKVFSKDAVTFKEEKFSKEELEIFNSLIISGTYGTTEKLVTNQIRKLQTDDGEIKRITKIKYTLKRVFPGMNYFKEYYPNVYRHKWLVPFAYIYRIFKGIFVKRKRLLREFDIVWKKK